MLDTETDSAPKTDRETGKARVRSHAIPAVISEGADDSLAAGVNVSPLGAREVMEHKRKDSIIGRIISRSVSLAKLLEVDLLLSFSAGQGGIRVSSIKLDVLLLIHFSPLSSSVICQMLPAV